MVDAMKESVKSPDLKPPSNLAVSAAGLSNASPGLANLIQTNDSDDSDEYEET